MKRTALVFAILIAACQAPPEDGGPPDDTGVEVQTSAITYACSGATCYNCTGTNVAKRGYINLWTGPNYTGSCIALQCVYNWAFPHYDMRTFGIDNNVHSAKSGDLVYSYLNPDPANHWDNSSFHMLPNINITDIE